MSGYGRSWKKDGERASAYGRLHGFEGIPPSTACACGVRVADRTWTSQSWNDCASRRSASSMTYEGVNILLEFQIYKDLREIGDAVKRN